MSEMVAQQFNFYFNLIYGTPKQSLIVFAFHPSSSELILKDKNKHFASSKYNNPKYGFLINQTIRFEIPIPIRGKLGFFNVEIL